MGKIETKIMEIDEKNMEDLKYGAEIIKSGGLVAFPTETVYGLGANGLEPRAVKKIFEAKGRPQDNPLILHIANTRDMAPLVESIPKDAEKLMEAFWPGPLTIIFKRNKLVPDIVSAGLDTVSIRMPNNPIALKLIELSDLPLAAPSANTSGKPSPTSAKHVMEDLYGKVDLIIDGGDTGIGVESTVLDMSGDIPRILRPGGITLEDLKKYLPNIEEDLSIIKEDEIPLSPGQKYRHYAPKAEMIVFSGELENIIREINIYANKYSKEGKKVGIMATDESVDKYHIGEIISLGTRKDKNTIAHNLFNTLRLLDEENVDIILAEAVEDIGIGRAIMNRLKKAASGCVIEL
ncbi:MAG: threonylcarbamoyl-AMP synthase [Tissierellia bacterium]|nr:threonylcarbamoyl-AMP synthase [Tissierellia bacterium]